MPETTIKTKAALILSIGILLGLLWQARLPLWNSHLQVDIWVWWERVSYWLKQGSFAGLSGNEILPATLLFIFTPLVLIPAGWASYANYLPAAVTINLLVVALHLVLVRRRRLFLIGLLAMGPILLFRFDALVTLLILLSFWGFNRGKFPLAGFSLGLATGLKVFPVIFLPYLILLLVNRKDFRPAAGLLLYFCQALLLPVWLFLLLGGSLAQISEALNFHQLKLISIESLPGTVITGWTLLFSGRPPAPIAGYGIWAIAGPAALFNRLWLVPVAAVYYRLRRRPEIKFDWNVPLALILSFLVLAKNLNPQYLWWFMVFLPFIKAGRAVWAVVLAVALLNQLVYPIFYTTLIEDFYRENRAYWVYYLLLLRNLGIVYLALKILYPFWSKIRGKLAEK